MPGKSAAAVRGGKASRLVPRTPRSNPVSDQAVVAPAQATPGTNGLVIRDPALIGQVAEYAGLRKQLKAIEDRLGQLRPLLEAAMGGVPVAYAGAHVLSLNTVPPIPETPNRIITADMVGQVIPGTKGRAGYTQLTVR